MSDDTSLNQLPDKYAIVDLETTGASAKSHKITEIGIVLMDGTEIRETYSTLINPERPIPYGITKFTGISNAMVADAPKFYEVAKKIIELTQNRIFVAHNVHFDYSFLKKEFQDLGYNFQRKTLCTVRLSRKYFPGHSSYSLGKISKDLGINLENAHRALDDSKACAELLIKVLEKAPSLQSDQLAFPPHLDPEEYHNLPENIGVYELFDLEGNLLYIGKSTNIKKRVAQHFQVQFSRKKELEFKNKIARIAYTLTYSELLSLVLENQWIKSKRPLFNIAKRSSRVKYGLNWDKLKREFCVRKLHEGTESLAEFKSRKTALAICEDIQKNFEMLPSFLDDEKKVYQVTRKYHYPYENFNAKEGQCLFSIENGRLQSASIFDHETGEVIKEYTINETIDDKNLLLSFYHQHKIKVFPVPVLDKFDNSF